MYFSGKEREQIFGKFNVMGGSAEYVYPDGFEKGLEIAAAYVAEIPELSQYHNAESSADWLEKLRDYVRQRVVK